MTILEFYVRLYNDAELEKVQKCPHANIFSNLTSNQAVFPLNFASQGAKITIKIQLCNYKSFLLDILFYFLSNIQYNYILE